MVPVEWSRAIPSARMARKRLMCKPKRPQCGMGAGISQQPPKAKQQAATQFFYIGDPEPDALKTNRPRKVEESEAEESQLPSSSWPQLAEALAAMQETIQNLAHNADPATDSTNARDSGALPENKLEQDFGREHMARANQAMTEIAGDDQATLVTPRKENIEQEHEGKTPSKTAVQRRIKKIKRRGEARYQLSIAEKEFEDQLKEHEAAMKALTTEFGQLQA